jgi:hypothetical protein
MKRAVLFPLLIGHLFTVNSHASEAVPADSGGRGMGATTKKVVSVPSVHEKFCNSFAGCSQFHHVLNHITQLIVGEAFSSG